MAASDLPVFKLVQYLTKHDAHAQHVLSCSDAESVAMKEILDMADDECKALWENLTMDYTETQGHHLLRNEIAAMYPGLTRADVIEVMPQEGIYMTMKVLTDILKSSTGAKQPHIVATFPAFQSLIEIPKSFGCDLSLWSIESEEAAWKFNIKTLHSLLREDTRLLIVNFPHNPTGFLPSNEDWQEIVDICKERNMFLFSDEMYHMTNNDGSEPYPSACAMYDKAITLSGLSKSYGLPGSRVGWLATKNQDVLRGITELKRYITICSSASAEILAIIALRNKDILLKRVLDIIKTNLEHLDKFFAEFPDLFEWHRPRACTTGFVRLKGKALTLCGGGAEGFCNALREESKMVLTPSSLYDFPDEYLRLGFGRKTMPDVLPPLREFVKKFLDA